LKIDVNKAIVFFDGECYFCNRTALFILQRCNKVQFAPLQSETAKEVFRKNFELVQSLNTLVLFDNNNMYIKSNALLRIFKKMNGLWPLLSIFGCIPIFVRDKLYDFFAGNRSRWFTKNKNCFLILKS
jgi:predicted DCC family thiol-disulfide oxidoreductase YuxK